MRKINQAGRDLIKKFEGLRLEAYYCPAGVLTIGYGHTGRDVKLYQKITKERAEALLDSDLAKFEYGVSEAVTAPLTDNQFAALVSFAYNVGLAAFRKSTMLKLINAKKLDAAGGEFGKWVKAGGVPVMGLVKRRKAELALWNS
jgi:lysozyme